MSWQAPKRPQFYDLTVGSADEFGALDWDDDTELAQAWKELQDCWFQATPPSVPETTRRTGPAAGGVPRPQVVAALKALGSSVPTQEPRLSWPDGDEDAPAHGGGAGVAWDAHDAALARMPSDRQVQRPSRMQFAEWSHLGPQLAVCGRQLAPDTEAGVQLVPAGRPWQHAESPTATSPHIQQGEPDQGYGSDPWLPQAIDQLVILGHQVPLHPYPAAASPAKEVKSTMCQEDAKAVGTHNQGLGSEDGHDDGTEEVYAEDGTQEEVLAVQWDAWEDPLLSWAKPRPRGPAGGTGGATSQQLSAQPASQQLPGQPQADAGVVRGWEGALQTEDQRDARALRQGLPPMRPQLSLCQQLVEMAMERWWRSQCDRLAPLVSARLQAREAARLQAQHQHHQQQQQQQRPATPPSEPSCSGHGNQQPSLSPDPGSPASTGKEEELGPAPATDSNCEQPGQEGLSHSEAPPQAADPRPALDWRMLWGSQPPTLPLGQGVLTPQGYQATPAQAPAPRVPGPMSRRLLPVAGSITRAGGEGPTGSDPPFQPTNISVAAPSASMPVAVRQGGAMWPSAGARATAGRGHAAFRGARASSMPARLPRYNPMALEPLAQRPRPALPPDRTLDLLMLQPSSLAHPHALQPTPLTGMHGATRPKLGPLSGMTGSAPSYDGMVALPTRRSAPSTPTRDLHPSAPFPPCDLPVVHPHHKGMTHSGEVLGGQLPRQHPGPGSIRDPVGPLVLPPLIGHQTHQHMVQAHGPALFQDSGRGVPGPAPPPQASPRVRLPGTGGPSTHAPHLQQQRGAGRVPAGALAALSEALQLGGPGGTAGSGSISSRGPGHSGRRA